MTMGESVALRLDRGRRRGGLCLKDEGGWMGAEDSPLVPRQAVPGSLGRQHSV